MSVESKGNSVFSPAHTPGRLRHPGLDPMASYVSAFGPEALSRVESDLRHFYTEGEYPGLIERLEFALTGSGTEPPSLRYYLFRLYNPSLIAVYFQRCGYPRQEIESLLRILAPVTPEFAVAVDLSPDNERLKLFCMRRDKAREGAEAMAAAIENLGRLLGVPGEIPSGAALQDLAVVGVDFYQHSPRRDLKIYGALHPDKKVIEPAIDRSLFQGRHATSILGVLDAAPPNSGWVPMFCLRTTNLQPGFVGRAFYAYIPRELWPEMDKALTRSAPEHLEQVHRLFARVRDRGWDVVVGHVGTSLSADSGSEKLHVYFSVV